MQSTSYILYGNHLKDMVFNIRSENIKYFTCHIFTIFIDKDLQ